MKLIIPMAGVGKRMRPHTLNTPKPLLKIAGIPLVKRIVLELLNSSNKRFSEIHFIIGDFGSEIEKALIKIAQDTGANGYIHKQEEALGTAHAVYCSGDALNGEVLVAFADTLFTGNFFIDDSDEAIIWTMRVPDPGSYGVVITDGESLIKEFSEKPTEFVSDEAIIGIYFFREAALLREKIEFLFKKKIMVKGEYQLTDALELLVRDQVNIKSKNIQEWLDCGNKIEFLNSAIRIIEKEKSYQKDGLENVRFFPPVYCGKNVKIKNSDIGPGVILEDGCVIKDSKIRRSIIYDDTKISESEIDNSIIGGQSYIKKANGVFNIGDFSVYEAI